MFGFLLEERSEKSIGNPELDGEAAWYGPLLKKSSSRLRPNRQETPVSLGEGGNRAEYRLSVNNIDIGFFGTHFGHDILHIVQVYFAHQPGRYNHHPEESVSSFCAGN